MASKSNKFKIVLNHARNFGGHEEIISIKDLETWKGISKSYSNTVFSSPSDGKIEISIDWSTGVSYAKKLKKLYSQPTEEVIKTLKEDPNFFEHPIVLPATVYFNESARNIEPWHGDVYLHQLLYEIFLIANFSSPGCFNLYRSYIKVPSLDPLTHTFAQLELELSEYMFETVWHDAQDLPWLKISFLQFNDVLKWYQSLGLGLRRIAKKEVEKVLFASLHLGRRSFLEPEATLWIASALEAIYDTPNGSSFQFLIKRISKFLVLDEKQQSTIKKRLREFYDIRNSFAHGGGFVICHPIPNESWDADFDKISTRIREANDFAFAVLFGSLQEFIRRKIIEIKFDEVIIELPSKT